MLFKFLKYLQPTHYFGLKTKNGQLVFPKFNTEMNSVFVRDKRYQSKEAQDYDIAWRAVQNGYVNYSSGIDEVVDISTFDNYLFARKYFSNVWVFYVFMLRLLRFKNPVTEIKAYYGTKHISRYTLGPEILKYTDYDNFESPLLKSQPFVSVIIPTLNRYQYLSEVLKDLEAQDYPNFEVIVVDQSEPFQPDFYKTFNLDLNVTYQETKALWLARNIAIKGSKADYILLFDDDSRVASDWITQHLKTLDFFNADISSGVSISKIGDTVPAHYAHFKISDQLDTGNVMLQKSIFKAIGLFDHQFEKQRMGDGEFGLRAFCNGYKNISNPLAKRLHLKVNSGGLREMGSWDAFRTKNIFQPRPIPSVLYFYRSYFGNKQSILAVLRTVPISIIPYKYKGNKPLLLISTVMAVMLSPILCYQVIKSWRLSSKKLKEGPKIEML